MTRIAEALEDAKAVFDDIKQEIGDIKHSTELTRWRHRNPLVLRYRALLLAVPEDMRSRKEEDLEELLNHRKLELIQIESAKVLRSGKQAKFGNETFPVFPETRLVWRPLVKATSDSEELGELIFRDSAGREFKPDWALVPFNIDHPETAKAIEANRADAEAHFENIKPRVPEFNSRWVLNDWSMGYLEKIAQACREQLELGQGIIILAGESASGKDVLWKMFAHFTSRGVANIPFNLQTEKEDITYDFEFNPQEGTKRITSKFLEAIQVPGTVCVLGEINTAPNGVVKMLNSAMDEARAIQITHGKAVEVDRSVILAGTMNPQHYLGTNKLAQDVISRATIIKVGYPPLFDKSSKKLLPYEAEILAKNHPALADVSQKEFYAMWDYMINKDRSSDGDKYLSKDRQKLISHLHRVVLIANKVRELYERYHSGEDVPPAEFVFGLRETCRIAARLRPDSKVGEVIKDVVLDKISSPEERMRIESIIDDPENFHVK